MEKDDFDINKLPPIYKSMFEHFQPPEGQGNDWFKLNWTIMLAFVPFLFYILDLWENHMIIMILFCYSILLIILHIGMISVFKKSMAFVSNPFDFVFIEFFLFVLTTICFGLAYFFLWKLNSNFFHGDIKSVFDLIYFSCITVTTVGYGDIYPISNLSKLIVMIELAFGLWFLVNIIPVAVADQGERIRHYRLTKNNVMKELKKAVEEGTLVQVLPDTEKKDQEKAE
jgi:hypothetical protein